MRILAALLTSLPLTIPLMAQTAGYTAQRLQDHGIEVVRLTDTAHHAEVAIVPTVGNMAYEFKINGKNILYFPFDNVAEFRDRPVFCGVPFLAPWANRIAGMNYWANGKQYLLNAELSSLRKDANGLPVHGVVNFSKYWELVEVKADEYGARVTSRLQFWKYPELMAQWPFAHEYEMTYRLVDGALEVATVVRNKSLEPMPISVGFHPYLDLPGVERDEWTAHLAARKSVSMDSQSVATGEFPALESRDVPLRAKALDYGFIDLIRDGAGHATFSVEGGGKSVSVVYGPEYTVAIAYAPAGKKFICFEPMTAVTNGVNLAHQGKYSELQTVAPNGEWRESFWIKASGI